MKMRKCRSLVALFLSCGIVALLVVNRQSTTYEIITVEHLRAELAKAGDRTGKLKSGASKLSRPTFTWCLFIEHAWRSINLVNSLSGESRCARCWTFAFSGVSRLSEYVPGSWCPRKSCRVCWSEQNLWRPENTNYHDTRNNLDCEIVTNLITHRALFSPT